jgi:hypothetical protein
MAALAMNSLREVATQHFGSAQVDVVHRRALKGCFNMGHHPNHARQGTLNVNL